MKYIYTFLLVLGSLLSNAQDSLPALQFSGYVEAFYAYDFAQPSDGERPSFLYNYDRHNEFNVNLAYLKATYTQQKVRGNFALMAGTYAQSNLILEPELARFIYEANAGIRLGSKHNLWLDMGVMPSHIGFESAIGKDCWTLSRSMIAENSPYYESGARLSFTSANEKWYLAALLLNGWQRIARVNGSNSPDLGTQVTYKPNAKMTFNWSTYIGNESYTSAYLNRYFNNFYVQTQLSNKWGLIFGADLGAQERNLTSNELDLWWSRVLIVRYSPSDKIRFALRAEDYDDDKNVVLNITNNAFKVYGISLNMDYWKSQNAVFRIEPRWLYSPNALFVKGDKVIQRNFGVTAALAVGF